MPEKPRVSGMVVKVAGRGTRVLVADDDEGMRSALGRLLSGEGFEVMSAVDGTEAIELLARAADGRGPRPDVVLLDFVMPGLSGVGILRAMLRLPGMPPAILLTGFPDPSVETFARSLGAVHVLRKPIDADEVLRVVVECATHGAPNDAACASPPRGREIGQGKKP